MPRAPRSPRSAVLSAIPDSATGTARHPRGKLATAQTIGSIWGSPISQAAVMDCDKICLQVYRGKDPVRVSKINWKTHFGALRRSQEPRTARLMLCNNLTAEGALPSWQR